MKPYRVVLATLLAGLLVTLPACSGDEDVIEDHAWEADLEGFVQLEPAEACSDLNYEGVQTITTAEGTMGDLGPVTARWAHCPGDDGVYRSGTVTFETDDGDVLSGEYDEVTDRFASDPESWPIEITGGTGRFADASGTVYLRSFRLDWAADPIGWSAHLDGTLAY